MWRFRCLPVSENPHTWLDPGDDASLQQRRNYTWEQEAVIYTAWGKDGSANTLIEGEGPPQAQDEENSELIWKIEAPSWEEAMQKYHTLQGWEPYRPMDC
jgi:hypothetical protein